VDRDGLLDLYLTQSGPSVLLRNLGEGLFVDATAVFGAGSVAEPNHMTFGGLLFDHDHDGWLDIAATAGPLHGGEQGVDPTLQEQPNVLLAGGPEGFEDIATRMGFGDLGAGRGVAAGFLNEDAFLDLVVTHLEAPSRIYLSVCTDAPALVVELEGRASPSFGEGARVEVHAGEVVLIREVSANPGWGAAMHPRAHFGLGDLSAERLVVYWPSGRTQEVALDLDGSARVRVVEAED